MAYSPEYLADVLAEQAEQLLSKFSDTKIAAANSVDDPQLPSFNRLRRALFRLHRRASSQHQPVLILVDGLHQVPVEDKSYVDEIMRDVLPFGMPSFKFIITVANSKFASTISSKVVTRPFTLVTLSPSECEWLCVSANLSKTLGIEIYGITKGHPGKVASAIRLLQAGTNISSLTGLEFNEFFLHEWNAIPNKTKELEVALAYVTFARRTVSVSDVIGYSDCSREMIESLIHSETFVKRGQLSDTIELVGDAQRRFLDQRLQDKKPEIVRELIDELVKNPKSDLALRFLPTYYETLHRTRELIKFLDADTLERYLEEGQSVSELLRQSELGFRAALEAKELQDALRFALNISFVRDSDSSDVWAPRLVALTAIGHFEDAYAVTQLPATQEERLYLMSLYAKAAYEAKKPKEAVLEERIRAICDSIDMLALGERAVDVSINLVGFFPDLALNLVEKTSELKSQDKDYAYVRLGISSGMSNRDNPKESGDSKQYLSRISDTRLQRFATAAEALVAGRSPDEFRAAIQQLSNRERLYFIQRWLVVNSELDGACSLIDDALQSLVQDTKYLPTATDLCEISMPLLFSKNRDVAPAILLRIDGHRGAISGKASTLDLLKLGKR